MWTLSSGRRVARRGLIRLFFCCTGKWPGCGSKPPLRFQVWHRSALLRSRPPRSTPGGSIGATGPSIRVPPRLEARRSKAGSERTFNAIFQRRHLGQTVGTLRARGLCKPPIHKPKKNSKRTQCGQSVPASEDPVAKEAAQMQPMRVSAGT
jgi:hypothetical protein